MLQKQEDCYIVETSSRSEHGSSWIWFSCSTAISCFRTKLFVFMSKNLGKFCFSLNFYLSISLTLDHTKFFVIILKCHYQYTRLNLLSARKDKFTGYAIIFTTSPVAQAAYNPCTAALLVWGIQNKFFHFNLQ